MPTVSLREYFDQAMDYQTKAITSAWKSHSKEHGIHMDDHNREHLESKEAIKIATNALDIRLDALVEQVQRDFDALTGEVRSLGTERTSAKGYMFGVGAVLGLLVVLANFIVPFIFK